VIQSPTTTEGPFWLDEKLNRVDIRADSDGSDEQEGLPLYIVVGVAKLTGAKATPLVGAQVDIWHANATGGYSGVSGMGNPDNTAHDWLRGFQTTNRRGTCRFKSIYPGWYRSRTAHIHARVRSDSLNLTTQFFFDDDITDKVYEQFEPYNTQGNRDTRNSNDNIYNAVSTGSTATCPDGCRLQLRMSQNNSRAVAYFNIVVV